MTTMTMAVISLIKATYHSNLFLQWNILSKFWRLLSMLWWKTWWRSHYRVRLIANCLERHRVNKISLSSLWIAIERLGLNCDTRHLQRNRNRDTVPTLRHCNTRDAAWKSHSLLLKIKKYRVQVSLQILCYSPCEHLTKLIYHFVLWCVHDPVSAARHPLQSFIKKTSKNIPPFVTTYNSAAPKPLFYFIYFFTWFNLPLHK